MGTSGTTRTRTTGAAIEPCYKELGLWLKAKRLEFELTQDDAAGIMKLSRPTIANIESGRQRVSYHVVLEMRERFTPEGVAEYRASLPILSADQEELILRQAAAILAARESTHTKEPTT